MHWLREPWYRHGLDESTLFYHTGHCHNDFSQCKYVWRDSVTVASGDRGKGGIRRHAGFYFALDRNAAWQPAGYGIVFYYVIAYRDLVKYGIQCKCYSSNVGNSATQEIYAGKTFYKCHVGIVMTNQKFTQSAIELAESNGIILWNRDMILKLIKNAR